MKIINFFKKIAKFFNDNINNDQLSASDMDYIRGLGY